MGKLRKSIKPRKSRKPGKHRKTMKKRDYAGIYTHVIPNNTPAKILKMEFNINNKTTIFDSPLSTLNSYNPSINKELVTLRSIPRNELGECNNKNAFLLKEPLQINVNDRCFTYDKPEAQEFLLNNLRANKHLNVKKMITPVQSKANCWFNTMFVTLFMSDKGRKFFHFFRQLMIEGKQSNGETIPKNLWNAFSLLNFAIEACLTGNEYAYVLDTNSIIRQIYSSIPNSYKKTEPYIVGVDDANNPIYYYDSLMNYLNVNTLSMMIVNITNNNWKAEIERRMQKEAHVPHFIVVEIYDAKNQMPGDSGKINNKEASFSINGYTYELDSCAIRDIEQEHFTAVLTCEGKEMAFDGASFHRIVPMKWKHLLNKNDRWKFKGTEHSADGRPYYWTFMHAYQMLFYYRTK